MIRNIYIIESLKDDKSIIEKQKMAKRSIHSVTQQSKYNKIGGAVILCCDIREIMKLISITHHHKYKYIVKLNEK